MRPAAVYLRVSTETQNEANQEPECRRLAEARGWTPLWFKERASGSTQDRPEWRNVLEHARRGELAAVVVWSLDRIGRGMFEVIADVRELARLRVPVVSVREPWLDTGGPAGDLLLAFFAWVAQHERDRLRERTRAGLERARAAGKRIGRPPAITAHALERARVLRAAGRSWSEVAEQLETDGVGTYTRGALSRALGREGSR